MSRARRGFTMVELLTTMTVIALLARFAVPKYQQFRLKATVTAAVADMRVIRDAAYNANAANNRWPNASSSPGVIPPAMRTLLPRNFTFRPSGTVSYDWFSSGMTSGPNGQPSANALMGMGVVTADAAFRAELRRQLGAQETLVSGNGVYWLIWGRTARP